MTVPSKVNVTFLNEIGKICPLNSKNLQKFIKYSTLNYFFNWECDKKSFEDASETKLTCSSENVSIKSHEATNNKDKSRHQKIWLKMVNIAVLSVRTKKFLWIQYTVRSSVRIALS